MNGHGKLNLALLSRIQPQLCRHIQENQFPGPLLSYAVKTVAADKPTVEVVTDHGRKFLHSQYSPQSEAVRWAKSAIAPQDLERLEGAIVLIIGWGLGYHVLEWIRLYGKQVESVIVWEPEPHLFIDSLEYIDLTDLTKAKRIEFALGFQDDPLYEALYRQLSLLLTQDLMIVSLPFVEIYPQEAVASYQKSLTLIQHRITGALEHMQRMGARCQENLIRNLRHAPMCLLPREVHGIAKNQPAIIVAAGPSLDKNIHQLHAAQGKSWIFAVDTSLRILQRQGIQAQIVVTKDPTPLNEKHFEGMENLASPALAFDPQIPTSTVDRFIGPRIWLPSRTRQIHVLLNGFGLQEIDAFPYSTNVAITAFHLARAMGCDPIIFVGLDLCFSKGEGISHASDSALQSITRFSEMNSQIRYVRGEVSESVQGLLVEGIDGQMYPTIENFYEALRLLEGQLASVNVRCIDATEGGAKIHGTEILTLDEVILRHCIMDVDSSVLQRIQAKERDRQKIYLSLLNILKCIALSRQLADKGLQLIESDEQIDLTSLEDLRIGIEEENRIYRALEPALERLLVEIDRQGYWNEKSQSRDIILQKYRHYFQTIGEICRYFQPIYDETANQIEG